VAPTLKSIEEDRPFPDRMYLDASVFVPALAKTLPDHALILKFIKESVLGPPRLYTSAVIFSEVNDALYKHLLRRRGEANLIDKPKVVPDDVWDEVEKVSTLLDALIANAHIEACKADGTIRSRAWQLQKRHKMRSFDALHAATCLQRGIDDFVCFDSDFHDPLDALTIWSSTELRNRWAKRLSDKT
jgi:predicted nucleic acid-binding protein